MRLLLLLENDQIGLCPITEPVAGIDNVSDSGDSTDEESACVDTQVASMDHVDTESVTEGQNATEGPATSVADSLVVTAVDGSGKPFYCCRIGSCRYTTCRRPNAERYILFIYLMYSCTINICDVLLYY